MQPKAKKLQEQEIVRFGITETKNSRSRTKNRVYSLRIDGYGKLVLLTLFGVLVLYGSGSVQALIKLFQKFL